MKTDLRETEAAFQAYVVDFLRLNGWKLHHSLRVRTRQGVRTPLSGSPGLPDIIATQGGRVAFLELKTNSGRLSEPQIEWLDSLAGVSVGWDSKLDVPPHTTKGDPWDILVGVLRPMWRKWFESTFTTIPGLAV